MPAVPRRAVKALLAHDAGKAVRSVRLFGPGAPTMMYGASKIALSRWVRRRAVLPEWAGSGVRMNALAPGAIMTPLLQEQLSDPRQGKAVRSFRCRSAGSVTPDTWPPGCVSCCPTPPISFVVAWYSLTVAQTHIFVPTTGPRRYRRTDCPVICAGSGDFADRAVGPFFSTLLSAPRVPYVTERLFVAFTVAQRPRKAAAVQFNELAHGPQRQRIKL
jgi:hypothetical protein